MSEEAKKNLERITECAQKVPPDKRDDFVRRLTDRAEGMAEGIALAATQDQPATF